MWMKVDDRMHSHRKTRAVTKSHPDKTRDIAPMGLWVAAGSWSALNGTDGWIPVDELDRWDDDWQPLADRLVRAGYWWRETRDGEDGYGFNDWLDYNPSSGFASSTGEFGNHVRWHVNRNIVDPECDHCPKEPDSHPDSPPDIGGRSGGDIGGDRGSESRPIALPDPTRPDPDPFSAEDKSSTNKSTTPRSKPRTRLPDNWQPTEEHKTRAVQDGIDLSAQVARFRAHAEANDRRQANWNAAFTQWLLNVPEWQRHRTGRPGPQATPFPVNGTEAEKDAWVKAQPLPADGAYYGGSAR